MDGDVFAASFPIPLAFIRARVLLGSNWYLQEFTVHIFKSLAIMEPLPIAITLGAITVQIKQVPYVDLP